MKLWKQRTFIHILKTKIIMNATADLIYTNLINLARTFNSREFRLEIEKLSLVELDQHIDKLTKTSLINDINRNEKLRLCLRLRNAYLINLPCFEVTKIYEWRNPFSNKVDKQIIIFYYLNFKNDDEIEMFKINTSYSANEKENIGVFIMKENSYGFEEMKKYTRQYGRLSNFILEIRSFQYNHLVSRNRLQEILFTHVTEPHTFPCSCVYDIIMTLHKGRNFVTARYPESIDDLNFDLTTTVKLVLQKLNLIEKENLVIVIMIEFNDDLDEHFFPNIVNGQDFFPFRDLFEKSMGDDGNGAFCFIVNRKMDTSMRVSIIATDFLQTGKSEVEIEQDNMIARVKNLLKNKWHYNVFVNVFCYLCK